MKWIAEWRALSKRIDQLREAADFIVSCDRSVGATGSAPGIADNWLPTVKETAEDISDFLERNISLFHPDTQQVCRDYQRRYKETFRAQPGGNPFQVIQYRLSLLLVFRAKLDHLIGDFELFARRTIERAFVHLQRTLIVDANLRNRWLEEFNRNGEVSVEKLGAVHLLLHGIWAFKVDSTGERTDLILGEPLKNFRDDINRAAEMLALTEWKIVKNSESKEEIDRVARTALQQAKLYASGSLSGLELEKWRYLILVSIERLKTPNDVEENGITFRHINIAINPASPSKQKL